MPRWLNRNPARVAAAALGALLALTAPAGAAQAPKTGGQARAAAAAQPKRANELTLGQLRPGRSTLLDAEKLFGAHNREHAQTGGGGANYISACWRSLQLDADASGLIQVITLLDLRLSDKNAADCSSWEAKDRLAMGERWRTGRGIRLGSARKQVVAVYGEPQSSGPSTFHDRELELLFYAFDWAGSDVPQVMEVTLEAGRVVKVTLAFPSL